MKDYSLVFAADIFEATRMCYEEPWNQYVPPFEVVSGVYYAAGIAWVGCYLVDTGDGLVLIDTAFHESVYLVVDAIWRLGYRPEDLKAIFLTHIHMDHINGARALQELSGAKIYMSKRDLPHLRDKRLAYNDGSAGHMVYGEIEPDYFYEDFGTICIGNIAFETIPSPGHTPGTTSIRFEVNDKTFGPLKVALHGGLGLNTMSKDYLEGANLPLSLRQEYLESMDRLKKLRVDVCIPSHPCHFNILERLSQKTEQYNPFIDETVWPALLSSYEENLRDMMKKEGGE